VLPVLAVSLSKPDRDLHVDDCGPVKHYYVLELTKIRFVGFDDPHLLMATKDFAECEPSDSTMDSTGFELSDSTMDSTRCELSDSAKDFAGC